MSRVVKIPFVLGSEKGFSGKNNTSLLMNLFPHLQPMGSKSRYILLNTDGLSLLESLPYTIYGIYSFKDKVYIFTSNAIYSYDGESLSLLDNTYRVNQRIKFADNGIEIVALADTYYAYNPDTNTLKDLTTEIDFYPANTVAFLDGYLIFSKAGTGQFFLSDLYATTFDGTQFATAESLPDNLVGLATNSRLLYLLGEQSLEVWYNAGYNDFPFTRVNGATQNIGCADFRSITLVRESIFFVGSDYRVYMTIGYDIKAVSNNAVEKDLFENKDKAFYGSTFYEYGHLFYVLEIDGYKTYVFDINTGQWHNRSSINSDGEYKEWKIQGLVNHIDKAIYGFSGNKFYEVSMRFYSEDGINIKRELITLPINPTLNRIRIFEVQLDMETGYNPEGYLYLEASKDGGRTWSNRMIASVGNVGENRIKIKWNRLGAFYDVVFKIYTYSQIPIRIIGLSARYDFTQ